MSHTITLLIVLGNVAACVTQDTLNTEDAWIVQTTQGPVIGNWSDEIYYFYGIPYATAPTGTRRFTAPLPGPVWMQPLEAVNKNIICPQGKIPTLNMSKFEMREDCLVANVYVPDTNQTNLPVVVYVHGGFYQAGFGVVTSPSPLVRTKKVIAVTFNYRLGVHGFLCLGTDNAPGNAGMKDQVALLHWVKKNIAGFGGNPDDVTIAGYNAGSSAVDLLMLSNMTKGLYNKVIPQSGASVGVWSLQIDPLQNAKDFAKQLNFTNVDDLHALDKFYSTASYDVIASDIIMLSERNDSNFVFSPCVERDIGVEMFLNDTPVNILTQGKFTKVPVLYGFTNMEGLFRMTMFDEWKEPMNERFSDFLPADLQFKDDEERAQIAQKIKEFYFGSNRVSENTVQGFIDYFTDVTFAYPHLRSTKLQVESGGDSIYLYEYSMFRPWPEDDEIPAYMTSIRGATHCAQAFATLESDFIPSAPDSEEMKNMRKVMIELWVNFITTGKPVPNGSGLPSWPPVGDNRSPYMDLGKEVVLKGSLLELRAALWDDIYARFYRQPIAPSTPKLRRQPEIAWNIYE